MRFVIFLFFIFNFSNTFGNEFEKNTKNRCKTALNENSNYKVSGVFGSSLESEWHPAATYVLLKEMYNFDVLRKEFQQKNHPWRFEFVEMSGGKIMAFVYNLENRYDYCNGPNAFYVVKK